MDVGDARVPLFVHFEFAPMIKKILSLVASYFKFGLIQNVHTIATSKKVTTDPATIEARASSTLAFWTSGGSVLGSSSAGDLLNNPSSGPTSFFSARKRSTTCKQTYF